MTTIEKIVTAPISGGLVLRFTKYANKFAESELMELVEAILHQNKGYHGQDFIATYFKNKKQIVFEVSERSEIEILCAGYSAEAPKFSLKQFNEISKHASDCTIVLTWDEWVTILQNGDGFSNEIRNIQRMLENTFDDVFISRAEYEKMTQIVERLNPEA